MRLLPFFPLCEFSLLFKPQLMQFYDQPYFGSPDWVIVGPEALSSQVLGFSVSQEESAPEGDLGCAGKMV
jgi:hypothetical protein